MDLRLQFGSDSDELAQSVAVDSDGNSYISGWTTGALAGSTSNGGYDAFLTKIGPSGQTLWTRQYGTSRTDFGSGVAVDPAGFVYSTGYTNHVLPGQVEIGGDDCFLMKHDQDGNLIWTIQFGTTGSDRGQGVAIDPNGNIVVTGNANGTNAEFYLNKGDGFIAKFDPDGNNLWFNKFGTTNHDYVFSVATDTQGNVYATGSTFGTFDEVPNNSPGNERHQLKP